MKKISIIVTLVFMLAAMLCGCKTNVVEPSVSPNVPVVSESPAIPSPDLSPDTSPAVTPVETPAVSPAM